MTKTTTKKPSTKKPVAKVDPDVIVLSKATSGQTTHYVKSAGGSSLTFPSDRWAGKLRELSAIGGSFAACKKHWDSLQVAKLAHGVTARNAPNAAKALADSVAKAKPTKAPAKPAAAKKAERAAAKVKASAADRPYKALVKFADTGIRPGTWTTFMVESILAHKSTAAASAATQAKRDREWGGKKLDFKWCADVKKFIAFTD